MHSKKIFVVLFASLLALLFSAAPARADLEDLKDACVVIYSTSETGESVSGSGFIVDEDGWIVTNAHVILSNDVTVKLEIEGHQHEVDAEVYYHDCDIDLAIIKVRLGGLTTAQFGDDNELRLGQHVFVLGAPSGFDFLITDGIFQEYNEELGMIMHSAVLNPGNSGGPLATEDGLVVGVNTYYIVDPNNDEYYFSIPVHIVEAAVRSVLDDSRPQPVDVYPCETGTQPLCADTCSPDYISALMAGYPDRYWVYTTAFSHEFTVPDIYQYYEFDNFINDGYLCSFTYPCYDDPYYLAVPDITVSAGGAEYTTFSEFQDIKITGWTDYGYENQGKVKLSGVDYEVYILVGERGTDADGLTHLMFFFEDRNWVNYYCIDAVYGTSISDDELELITLPLIDDFIYWALFN